MCTEYLMMQCGVHVIKDELLNYCVDDVMYEYCEHYNFTNQFGILVGKANSYLVKK